MIYNNKNFVIKEGENGMSIYEKMKTVVDKKDIDHHESDLYVPVTKETKAIIDQYPYKANVTTFVCNITGRKYYDIPFAYEPYWNEKIAKNK